MTFHGWPAGDLDLSRCYGQADGYAMTGPTAFRDWLQPFEIVLRLDGAFDRGGLTFRSRSAAAPSAELELDDLIDAGEASRFTLARTALEDAARAVILRYVDGLKNYERGAAQVAIEAGLEEGIAEADTPLVLDKDRASVFAETILRSSAATRERIALALPPSAQAFRPGLLFSLDLPEVGPQRFLVEKVERGETIKVEATIYARAPSPSRAGSPAPRRSSSSPAPRRSCSPSSTCRRCPARPRRTGRATSPGTPRPGRAASTSTARPRKRRASP